MNSEGLLLSIENNEKCIANSASYFIAVEPLLQGERECSLHL
jgi:hypothetical protein